MIFSFLIEIMYKLPLIYREVCHQIDNIDVSKLMYSVIVALYKHEILQDLNTADWNVNRGYYQIKTIIQAYGVDSIYEKYIVAYRLGKNRIYIGYSVIDKARCIEKLYTYDKIYIKCKFMTNTWALLY